MEIILIGVLSVFIVLTLLFFSIKSEIILSKPYTINNYSKNEKWKYSFEMTIILMMGFLGLLLILILIHIPIVILVFVIIGMLLSPIILIIINKLRIEAQISYYLEVDNKLINTGSTLPWNYKNYFYILISEEYRKFIKVGY